MVERLYLAHVKFWWELGCSNIASNAIDTVRIVASIVVVGLGEVICSTSDIAITPLMSHFVPIS